MADKPKRTSQGTFAPGSSGNPGGKSQQSRRDGWVNFFTGLGVYGRDKRQGASFTATTLTFDSLAELWRGDDLAARAVETLPREALREGYDVIIPENEDEQGEEADAEAERIAEVMDKLKKLGADQIIRTAACYERGIGGGCVLLGANDKQADLTKPLNYDDVVSLDWLTPLEAREIYPVYGYADPRAPKYGQPEIYRLTSRAILPPAGGAYSQTVMEIHESRLLLFPGIRVSRYQPMAAQGGWGDSVLIRMWRVLRDFNLAWGGAGVLVSEFAKGVYKMSDLWDTLSSVDGASLFAQRLSSMELAASTINATVIDGKDDYKRDQTPLSGLSDLLSLFAERLCATAEMPRTKLFGTSPAGLSATGESDIRQWYDNVAAYQKEKLEPHYEQLIKLLFRVTGNKKEPEKWSLRWKPLWQESAADRAKAMLTQAQADHTWYQDGVLSAEEIAKSHWGTGEWTPEISIDFDARDKQQAAASAPVSDKDLDAMGYAPPPGQGTARPSPDTAPPGAPSQPDPNQAPQPIVQNDGWRSDGRRKKKRRRPDDWRAYVPPPKQGTRRQAPDTPEPGPPAAPDPNQPPQPFVQNYDARRSDDFDESQHPRDEHGRFGQAAGELASELVKEARAGETGRTIDPRTGASPKTGYVVATDTANERKLSGKDGISADALRQYVQDHEADLARSDRHVGIWYSPEKDTWFLDTPRVVHTLDEAVRLGQQHKQLAVWDLKRGESINDHEYEDALARRGRFAGRTDSAGRAAAPGVRPAHHDAGADGRGDAGTPRGRAEGRGPAGRVDRDPAPGDKSIAERVYNSLAGDYSPAARQWILRTHWSGPEFVPLREIDFSNRDAWRASEEDKKVARFEKRVRQGWEKPILLIKRPGIEKLLIADGHHRALAHWNLDEPIMAYIAHVPSDHGPWDEFHDSQHEKRHDSLRIERGVSRWDWADGGWAKSDDFEESQHPRAADGKFTAGGGESAAKPAAAPAAPAKDAWKGKAAGAKDTKTAHFKEGKYDDERRALHDRYIQEALKDVPKSQSPGGQTAYLTGGGPAAGKTTGLLENKDAGIPDRQHAAHINADDAKEHIPEYRAGKAAGAVDAAAFAHEESADMSREGVAQALASGHDLVYDSTGDGGLQKLTERVEGMRRMGVKRVVANYAAVDVDEAIRRSDARGERSGRYVPHDVIRGIHRNVAKTATRAIQQGLFDEAKVWDTTGRTPKLIASFDRDRGFQVHDQPAWDAFVKRGDAPLPPGWDEEP